MPIKITPKQLEMLRANIPNYKKNISENEKNLKPNKPSERGEGNKRDATLAYYGDRELNEAAGIAKPILSKISNFLQTLATPMFAGKNPDGTPYYGTDKGIRNVDLFNQYEPTAYPGVIAGVKGISPNPRYIEFDKEGDFKPWDEAWAKALGLPNKGKYIVESPYKPTSAKKDGKLTNKETLKNHIIQVVGHTPQDTIDIEGKSTGGRYYFIDTLEYGQNQYLVVKNGVVSLGELK